MTKKNILIVSRSFYPMKSPRSYRTTELVKEFSRQGHAVTLMTIKNDDLHSKFENDFGVTIKDLGPLRFPTINITRSNRFFNLMSRGIQRGLELFLEYPDIELLFRVKNALKDESNYDLLISIAVPHSIHWGVAFARSEDHPIAETWVADCGDPYMGFTMDRFNKPFYFKYLEQKFCRSADYISVPVEEAKDAYYDEFRRKIRVIPQGFNFEKIDIDRSQNPENPVPILGYAGNILGGGRNPHELLEYLVSQGKPFKFIIYTQKPGPAQSYIKKADGKIEIRDYIPRKELLLELAEMDFLVNLENDTPRQVPSKLIDYYLTGRPVLSVPSQGLNEQMVDRFLEGDYSEEYCFEDMERYRIENVCQKFLNLCKKT